MGGLVDRLVDQSVGWSVGPSVSRLVGWLVDQLVSKLVGWSVGRSVSPSVSLSVNQQEGMEGERRGREGGRVGRQVGRYIASQIDRQIDRQKDFLFSKVTDCRHATWLKINFFTGIFYCVTGVTGQPQLASLQFFDLQFFKITYQQLQLFHQGSFKKYEKCVEAFMIQYPKKFYEDPYPKKCFSRVKNEIKYFPHFLSIP